MVDCNKRLVEVDAILNYLSQKNYKKIPQEIIKAIKENMDKTYNWKYDESKELQDQEVNRDTIAILSYINTEYLLNDEQKAYMQRLYEENEQERLKKEYEGKNDYSDLFKRNTRTSEIQEEKNEQTSLIVYKENIFKRFWNKLKSFFNI